MAEKIKGKGKALPQPQAQAGSEITATDVARARVKWARRVAGLEERLREAKGDNTGA